MYPGTPRWDRGIIGIAWWLMARRLLAAALAVSAIVSLNWVQTGAVGAAVAADHVHQSRGGRGARSSSSRSEAPAQSSTRSFASSGGGWVWQPASGPGLTTGPVTYAPGSNGSLQELFTPGPQGAVWTTYESPGGAWSPWHPQSGPGLTTGPITYAPGSNGSLQELFTPGPQGAVWTTYESPGGAWSPWHPQSGPGLTTGPVTYAPGSNGSLQELFTPGPQGAVWTTYELPGGAWSPWHPQSGPGLTTGPVTYAPRGNETLQQLFAPGPHSAVWTTDELPGGAWSVWHRLSPTGLTTGPITSAPGSNGSLQELFAPGPQGAVWTTYELPGGAWSLWHPLSPTGLTTGPITSAPGNNGSLQELFAPGPQGAVWTTYEFPGGAWSLWHPLSPTGLTTGLVTYAPGSNGSLQELFLPGPQGTAWSAYEQPEIGLNGAHVAIGLDTPESKEGLASAELGRTPAILNAFIAWSVGTSEQPFPASFVDSVVAGGAMPMLTWEPSTTSSPLMAIADGTYDSYLRSWAEAAAANGHVIYLRILHEMNGPWYPWGLGVDGNTAAEYVNAFQHIVDIFRAAGASNVEFIWCVATSASSTSFTELFPGDSYVSWVAMDGYNKTADPADTMEEIFAADYAILTAISTRPIMIAETATIEDPSDPTFKADWITTGFFSAIPSVFPRIIAVMYFDRVARGHSYPFDTSPASLAAMRQVFANPYYQLLAPQTTLTI